jgi:hypothetical protein
MDLLRDHELLVNEHDRVYRYSRVRAILAYALLVAGCIALFVAGQREQAFILRFAAVFTGACLYLARRFALARFRDSNWLVRANDNGLYVHLRSYLNYHFPADDLTVAFIPYREIGGAHAVRERREVPEMSRSGRTVSVQSVRMAELELTCDTGPLGAALAEERARPAPRVATWYGNSGVRYQHEPVTLVEPGRLRLTWECVPSVETFLAALGRYVSIRKSETRSTSYSDLDALSRAEQEQRLAELARSGQLVAAITTARRLYGYDLRQASEYVESLRAGQRRSA